MFIIILIISFFIYNYIDEEVTNSSMMYVSVRHDIRNENIHYFDWYVENRSKKNESILTFKNGNILNYVIKCTNKNLKYESDKDHNFTVVLKKSEQYHTTVNLELTEKGHYIAKFWATSEEGTQGTMEIQFDIE